MMDFYSVFEMERDSEHKSFFIWIEEIWEEIEVQFYGIIGAIFFFILVYLIFRPSWMKEVFHIFFEK
tara:strand:- start:124 stop:324 length:201 start_codon:yes stop_codon:yes gene_type:complete